MPQPGVRGVPSGLGTILVCFFLCVCTKTSPIIFFAGAIGTRDSLIICLVWAVPKTFIPRLMVYLFFMVNGERFGEEYVGLHNDSRTKSCAP